MLADLFITRGVPEHVRSNLSSEFTAVAVKGWITGIRIGAAYIELDNP